MCGFADEHGGKISGCRAGGKRKMHGVNDFGTTLIFWRLKIFKSLFLFIKIFPRLSKTARRAPKTMKLG
jgi:hypothetical protein